MWYGWIGSADSILFRLILEERRRRQKAEEMVLSSQFHICLHLTLILLFLGSQSQAKPAPLGLSPVGTTTEHPRRGSILFVSALKCSKGEQVDSSGQCRSPVTF